MRKGMQIIASASQAIDALDGTAKVAKLFNPPLDYRVVSNWRNPKRGFPPDTYHVLAPALMRKGCSFSPLLFAQKLPAIIGRRRASPRSPTNPIRRTA